MARRQERRQGVRRARIRLARWRRALLAAWDRGPRGRAGTALALALLVNAGLAATFARMPLRLPPEGAPSAPIEIVRLPEPPTPPVPAPAPDPARADPEAEAPDPAPAAAGPPPASAPEAALPPARGTSGVVALDCNRVFGERARAVACAGGRPVLGYDLDREAWRAIGERLPGYGPAAPDPPPAFGRADDPRFAVDPARRRAFADGRPSARVGASPVASGGAEDAVATGADLLAPPSFVTSHGDRRQAEDEADRRRDARDRRLVEGE